MRLRITTAPAPSTPCTWNTDFAISRPIVLTSPMDGSPQCGLLRQNHPMALLMPQSGRRPQHQKQTFCSAIAMSALPPIATSIAFFGMSALGQAEQPQFVSYSITAPAPTRLRGRHSSNDSADHASLLRARQRRANYGYLRALC